MSLTAFLSPPSELLKLMVVLGISWPTSLLVWWFCWNVRVTKHEELPLPQMPRWRSTFPHPSQYLYNHQRLHCEREGLWPFLKLHYFCLCCFEVDTIISISKMGKQGLRAGKQPTLNFKVSRQLSQTNPSLFCFFQLRINFQSFQESLR